MQTTIPFEKLLFGVRNFVQANLAPYLTAIAAEAADGIPLPDFVLHRVGYRNPLNMSQYPAMLYIPDRIEPEPAASQVENLSMDVVLVFGLRPGAWGTPEAAAEIAVKVLLRYSDALRTLFAEHDTLGGLVMCCYVEEIQYIPPAEDIQGIAVGLMRVRLLEEIRD